MEKIYTDWRALAHFMEITGYLGALIPVLAAIICTSIWWKRLSHPVLFLTGAVFFVHGLYGALRWTLYMLEMTIRPEFLLRMDSQKRDVWFALIANGGGAIIAIVLGAVLLYKVMRLQERPAALAGN